ncbi:3255_t:CDS:2 [Acaulospora colombiana]|uniref:3255_t:CDS:1 n=1 Tax=Acaulospora colombiana TaxID=27376 RepID=A0ACA9K4G8_9GLOM|nr:3255_t:CDS:2 [Acaulospora colombiana]
MPFRLPKSVDFGIRSIHFVKPLPFDINKGLAPLFSNDALKELWEYQSSLIDTLNGLVAEDTEFEQEHIYNVIVKTAQVPEKAQLFNCASQVWNNDFFLQTLECHGSDKRSTPLQNSSESIRDEFGSFEDFQKHFKYMALGLFGSGWTWLVLTEFRVLRVINTYNAGTTLDTTRLQPYDPNNFPSPLPNSPFLFTATSPFSPTANINESTKPLPPPLIKLAQEPPHKSKFTPILGLNWKNESLPTNREQITFLRQFQELIPQGQISTEQGLEILKKMIIYPSQRLLDLRWVSLLFENRYDSTILNSILSNQKSLKPINENSHL